MDRESIQTSTTNLSNNTACGVSCLSQNFLQEEKIFCFFPIEMDGEGNYRSCEDGGGGGRHAIGDEECVCLID